MSIERTDSGNISHPKKDIYFAFHAKYVVAANRGRPFTPQGLDAICSSFRSNKGGEPFSSEDKANQCMENIRNEYIREYRGPRGLNRLEEDAGGETEIRRSYSGRLLLELMQNADDALGEEPIGYKGLGFKSVLNISSCPRIHSGFLHCGFDKQKSWSLLKRSGLRPLKETPVLRLPFHVSECDEPYEIRRLMDHYDTVIILPFRDKAARQRFEREWRSCLADETVLLFLHRLEGVDWEESDRRIAWGLSREGNVVHLSRQINDEKPSESHWKIFSHGASKLALRVNNVDGKIDTNVEHKHLRAFFPTEEPNPFQRLLLHAPFALQPNRNHVELDDEDGTTERSIRDLAELIRKVMRDEVGSSGSFIDFLKPRVAPEQMNPLERRLWEEVRPRVEKLSMPDVKGATFVDVQLSPSHLIDWQSTRERLALWHAFKDLLRQHRPGSLSGLPLLPSGVDTEEREEIVLTYFPGARLRLDELKTLPLFPIQGKKKAVAPAESAIFFPPKDDIPEPPEGMNIAFLEREFANAVQKHEKRGNLIKLFERLDVNELKPHALLEQVVLPGLDDGRQPDGLLDFLLAVVEPLLKDKDLFFDWRDVCRRKLARQCKVPCRGGAMRPASDVYAGYEWTGNEALDELYGKCVERAFLSPPPRDEKLKERWRRLYQWMGVGWCPKALPLVLFKDEEKTYEGPKWQNDVFPLENAPRHWKEHCKSSFGDTRELSERKARLRQDWTIDGGEQLFRNNRLFSLITAHWRYYEQYKKAVFYCSSNIAQDYDNQKGLPGYYRDYPSYLLWMMRNLRWIPVRETEKLQRASDVFVKSSEVVRDLEGIIFTPVNECEKEIATAIGIRDQWSETKQQDWERWLERASKFQPHNNVNHRILIQRLYRAALHHAEMPEGPIWLYYYDSEGQEYWKCSRSRIEPVYYIDRPDLAELKLAELCYFPVRLENLHKLAVNKFEVRLLSEHLHGEPVAPRNEATLAEYMLGRKKDRLPYIRAYLRLSRQLEPLERTTNAMEKLDVRVVRNLSVAFSVDGKPLGDPCKLDHFFDHRDDGDAIFLDKSLFDGEGKPKRLAWEYLAHSMVYTAQVALGEAANLRDILEFPEDELEKKLLNLGLTPEAIREVYRLCGKERGDEVAEINQEPDDGNGGEDSNAIGGGGKQHPRTGGGRESGAGTSEPRKRPHADTGNGIVVQAAQRKAKEAENWMRNQLRDLLGQKGWEVSCGEERETVTETDSGYSEVRSTDIVLRKNGKAFHVEVKYTESGTLFWSKGEVNQARERPHQYFMAILTPSKDDELPYKVYWLWEPLEELKHIVIEQKTGVWPRQKKNIPIDTSNPWEIPALPRELNFSFELRVNLDDFLPGKAKDILEHIK